MMRQTNYGSSGRKQINLSGVEAPAARIRRIVEALGGRARACVAVVGRPSNPLLRLHVAGATVPRFGAILHAIVKPEAPRVGAQTEQADPPIAGASVLRYPRIPKTGGSHQAR